MLVTKSHFDGVNLTDAAVTRQQCLGPGCPRGRATGSDGGRGRSDGGQKTLLDVLIPLQQALASPQPVSGLGPLALAAAEATTPMLATRGRASFLGERSIGHMDPGARSSALMLVALLEALTAAPAAPQLTP